MKIVSSAKISEKHQIKLKKTYTNADFHFYDDINEAEKDLETADVLITYGEDLTDDIIRPTNLKWIQIISAGIDKIPFNTLAEKEIIVTNAKGIHYIPMSEYTFAVLLQLARRSNDIYKNQLENVWDRTIRVSEIHGTTIGVIGLGSIGSGIVNIANAFNMRVIGLNRSGNSMENVEKVYKPEQIKELMAESDFVVVIVPLTDETYHLIGKEELNEMKESAYIINIARGDVIVEKALIEALKNKKIAGAALDVFSEEPLPADHPYWTLDNCIITPHLSGRSPQYMERALEIFNHNLSAYLNGKYNDMKNLIQLEKGY